MDPWGYGRNQVLEKTPDPASYDPGATLALSGLGVKGLEFSGV